MLCLHLLRDPIEILPVVPIIFFMAKGSDLVLHVVPSCRVSLISFNLHKLLSVFLVFLTVTFLKISNQLFYRMSFLLGLSSVCAWLDSGHEFLARISQDRYCILTAFHQVAQDAIFSITGGINYWSLGIGEFSLFHNYFCN